MEQVSTKNKRINIWQYQFILARRLAWWGVVSFAVGLALFSTEAFFRGFGIQAIIWGLIDTAIAVGSAMWTSNRRSKLTDPAAKEVIEKETHQLRKLLWRMVPLDVIYVLVGLLIAFTWGRKDAWWLGTGCGIVVQGLFLLGFDWFHAKKMPTN